MGTVEITLGTTWPPTKFGRDYSVQRGVSHAGPRRSASGGACQSAAISVSQVIIVTMMEILGRGFSWSGNSVCWSDNSV